MRDISTETILVIEWGIVPLILIGILAHCLLYNPGKNPSERLQKSSTSGKFAGLLIFVLFVLSQKTRDLTFSFDMPAYDFDFIIVSSSIVAGIIFSWFFHLIKKRNIIGLYTLLTIASTSIAIYTYLYIQNLRSYLVFVTLGIMLGIFTFSAFFPKIIISDEKLS